MRVAVAALVFACCVTAAAAKEAPTGLRVCGASGCATVADSQLARSVVGDSTAAAAAPPAAYVTVEVMPRSEASYAVKPFYYVPSAHVIRIRNSTDVGEWRAPGAAADAALAGAVARLRPFPAPARITATVDRRPVRDAASYLRLYTIAGPSRPDPAGRRPTTIAWSHAHQWAVYYGNVKRVWAYVNLQSTPPTPWSDGASDLWVGRHADLVRRNDTVVAVPRSLAAKVRAGQSLR